MGLPNNYMKKVMISSFMTLICASTYAQEVLPNTWQNTGTSSWSTNSNWLLESGTQAVPSNEFGEYALLNNGGTANVTSVVSEMPYAVFLGQAVEQSATLNIAGGTLSIHSDGLDAGSFTPGSVGMLVVGLAGSGSVNVSAGTLNLEKGLVVGAGGGEGGQFSMTGGTVNLTDGEFDLAGNVGNGRGTFNMSGGQFNISGTDQDWDIGGIGGGIGTANLSGTAEFNSGDIFVGLESGDSGNGTGILNVSNNAVVNVNNLIVSNSLNTVLSLQNSARINVTNDATISRRLRTTGTSVNMTVANNLQFTASGSLNPVISNASSHSVINVTGGVALGGTLDLEFDGVTPSIGDTWTLVTGAQSVGGKFDNVTGPKLQKGVRFGVQTTTSDVAVTVETALTLKVNTVAGSSSIVDFIGGTEIASYVIKSKSGVLDVAGWNSMADASIPGWEESSPREHVASELNLESSLVFTAGQSHGLGKLISNFGAAMPFGQSLGDDEFTMTYKTMDGVTREAILDVHSLENNLVLTVDPATGMAVLQNRSLKSAELGSYVIGSKEGSLDVEAWDSLADQDVQGWEEASPTANHLSELNLEGLLTLAAGQTMPLGQLMSVEAIEDLVLEFRLNEVDGSVRQGVVVYGDLPTWLDGDIDLDGDVDIDDLAIVKNGMGDNFSLADLFSVRNNFGATEASSVTAIPEPTSIVLVGLGLLAAARRRNQ